MQNDWDIKSRGHVCAQTGQEFSEGEFFYTLLFHDKDGFRREDVSESAWQERNDNIQPFSFWRSRYEPPPPPAPEPLPKDDAEGLLRRIIAANDPGQVNAAYVLALMLERKKMLRPMESHDADLLVYEHVGTSETFIIKNPHLSLEQIPDVQREVAGLLNP